MTASLWLPSASARPVDPHQRQAHFDDAGWLTFVPQSCSPDQTGLCTISASGVVDYTGQLDGFSEYHTYGWFDPSAVAMKYELWETFTGTVDGCGTGSFRWYATGSVTSDGFDPTTMTTGFSQTFRVLSGAGTGALASLEGTGSASGRINLLTRENHGTLLASIHC